MSEERLVPILEELVAELRNLRGSVDGLRHDIGRLGEASEFFVRRVKRSDERLVEELTRQRMGRDQFSE